uniref:Uncharacterized protein n=1 Tax=Myotis myotis TaxID=51298 RepID=A0A7J7ZYR9_MYOMY|nr:hypothetical protein mMyoMyo1_009896 [Myotis myotis]
MGGVGGNQQAGKWGPQAAHSRAFWAVVAVTSEQASGPPGRTQQGLLGGGGGDQRAGKWAPRQDPAGPAGWWRWRPSEQASGPQAAPSRACWVVAVVTGEQASGPAGSTQQGLLTRPHGVKQAGPAENHGEWAQAISSISPEGSQIREDAGRAEGPPQTPYPQPPCMNSVHRASS